MSPYSFFCFSLQNVRIDPSSISFGMWKDIPVPFYMSVYFFEVLNPNDVLKGAKPVLNQRGPYVYRSGTAYGPAWHEPGHRAACQASGRLPWQEGMMFSYLVRVQWRRTLEQPKCALIALILLKPQVGLLGTGVVRLVCASLSCGAQSHAGTCWVARSGLM